MALPSGCRGYASGDRKDLRTVLGDGDRVLELGRALPIASAHRPAVTQRLGLRAAHVEHGLDGEYHANPQLITRTGFAMMQHVWQFMQRSADTVADIIAHHGKAVGLGIGLDRGADVAQSLPRLCLLNAQVQALFGGIKQPLGGSIDLPHGKCHAGVAHPAIVDDANIDSNNVPVAEYGAVAWNTMADHFIGRDTDGSGERHGLAPSLDRHAGIPLVNGCGPSTTDVRVNDAIKLRRGNTRHNVFPQHCIGFRDQPPCVPQAGNLKRRLKLNWHSVPFPGSVPSWLFHVSKPPLYRRDPPARQCAALVCYDYRQMSDLLLPVSRAVAPTAPSPLVVSRLGLVPYAAALHEQRRLQAARIAGTIPDTLLLLEHPAVYTLGRNSAAHHILYSEEFLRAQGASVEHNERGGEVTFHGPGQLVAYPIILLREHERSLSDLVWRLEEVVVRTLADFGVAARREQGERGVWVEERKIASLGLSVRRWVVMHGVALNVDPDLRYFSYINPCGHAGLAMTSIRLETGANPGLDRVAEIFTHYFAMIFGREPGAASGTAMVTQEERV